MVFQILILLTFISYWYRYKSYHVVIMLFSALVTVTVLISLFSIMVAVSLRKECFCSIFGGLVRLVYHRLQCFLQTFGIYQWFRYFWHQKSKPVAFRCKIKKKNFQMNELKDITYISKIRLNCISLGIRDNLYRGQQ